MSKLKPSTSASRFPRSRRRASRILDGETYYMHDPFNGDREIFINSDAKSCAEQLGAQIWELNVLAADDDNRYDSGGC